MDHLLLPALATASIPRVPYLCKDLYCPDDLSDFLTYPDRAGEQWKDVLPNKGKQPFWWIERNNPRKDQDLEPFFQCWIFFGLLKELLQPYDLFELAHFVENGQDFVHTRNLADKLHIWCEKTRAREHEDKVALKIRLTQCLALAYESMRCLLSDGTDQSHGHPHFNRAIRTSIVSICEIVSVVGDMTLDVLPDIDWLLFDIFATFNDEEKRHMRRHGWCPSMIASEDDHSPIAYRYFLLNLARPSCGWDHSDCTESDCKHVQIDEHYRPRHVNDWCECKAIGPDVVEVANCLDSGTFPVLATTGDTEDTLSVKSTPYDNHLAYVALSHVWVDGLGNPTEMTLPRCQLYRLRGFIEDLRGKTFRWHSEGKEQIEDRGLYLWCDSLVCPIRITPSTNEVLTDEERESFDDRPDVRRSIELSASAMKSLRDVYTKAAYVLVLDRELQQISFSAIGSLEATIRLLCSRWMHRLWTYQEAALPLKLLIKFSDEVVDFRELAVGVQKSYHTDPLLRSICRTVGARCVGLRSLRFLEDAGGPDLLNYYTSVRHRKVKYQQDEPLCAGAFLGLDVGSIATATTFEARMAVFWRLLSDTPRGIPDNIVFNEFPRLSFPGLRWAPTTFRHDMNQPVRYLVNPHASQRATLSEAGLRIQGPGYRLKAHSAPWVAANSIWNYFGGNMGLLHVKDSHGIWYSISMSDRNEASPWTLLGRAKFIDWHLLVDKEELYGNTGSRRCVLGFMQQHHADGAVFQAMALVNIRPLTRHYMKIMSAAPKHAEAIRTGSNFRRYQLCDACAVVLYWILMRFPSLRHFWLMKMLRRLIGGLTHFYLRQFLAQLMRYGSKESQTHEIMEVMQDLTNVQGSDFTMAGHIGIAFSGKFASIVETFDDSYRWCIG